MALNYKELGFKCGIEAHQQLEGLKLFCNCPTTNSRKGDDIKVNRKLRAVIGETGEVDKAAAFEMSKCKKINYIGNRREACLVELDEEPPHEINKEALETVLIIAKLLNAKVVDEVQVMRKTVVDGSNTTGFQRTALVAYDGYVETSKGKVRIPSICIEEEACQRVSEDKDSITYRLDRLGIPLIEIATEPDIVDNEHAKETAEKLGMILRSTGKVKRGIGTIRQDVNVSIKGSSRVEIKGFQELKLIPKVVETEVKRLMALKEKNEPEVRKFNPDGTTEFLRPMPGAARMYPETDVVPIVPEETEVEVELIDDKIKKIEKLGIGKDLASKTVKTGKADIISKFITQFKNVKPAFIAETVISYTPELLRKYKGMDPLKIKEEHLNAVFQALDEEMIANDSMMDILAEIASGKGLNLEKYSLMSDAELEKELKKIVSENKGAPFNALIGKAMGKLRGKAPGKKIAETLKKIIQ